MKLDLEHFEIQKHIEAAARQTFAKALADHPRETFFAFALTTLDTRQYVNASLNSHENLKVILSKAGKAAQGQTSYYKWYPNEWARFEYYGQKDGIWSALDKRLTDMEEQIDGQILSEFGLSEFPWDEAHPHHRACVSLDRQRREHVTDAMISGLKSLDAQGCFGEGEERGGRLAFVDIYDDEGSADIRSRSVEEINRGRASQSLIEEFKAAA